MASVPMPSGVHHPKFEIFNSMF